MTSRDILCSFSVYQEALVRAMKVCNHTLTTRPQGYDVCVCPEQLRKDVGAANIVSKNHVHTRA